jgi:dihydropteroate synthase
VFDRRSYLWHTPARPVTLGERTLIMGILNLTPDSFSDGGQFANAHAAIEHGARLLAEGAGILDLGAESTRPGAQPLDPAEEMRRLLPVLTQLRRRHPRALLSIDTYHAETAAAAVAAGADIVNDVSGGLWDPSLLAVCAKARCGLILTHTRGRPQQWSSLPPLAPEHVVPLVLEGLRERLHAALSAGIPAECLVLDPGFGFGKALDENYSLLAGLSQLHQLHRPILAGVSRKGFLRRTIQPIASPEPATQTAALEDATTSANVAAILAGAHILRVHNVTHARRAAAVADRILHSVTGPESNPPQPALTGGRNS